MQCARPSTKIFLDSGDPAETREMIAALGFLDGQTTNPTLIARHPAARDMRERGAAFTPEEVWTLYRDVARDVSAQIPAGSVSLEVYADERTTASEMMKAAAELSDWIPNAHIKFPITASGLAVAQEAVRRGIRVNMTLCFSQEQAAAVYAATRGAGPGQVFVSPFVGRLDDQGKNGMDLVSHIMQMYGAGDGHVEVLAASIRGMDHFFAALRLGADIITAPAKVLREWAGTGCPLRDGRTYSPADLAPIPYEEVNLALDWKQFSIDHELTTSGIARFSADWNALIGNR